MNHNVTAIGFASVDTPGQLSAVAGLNGEVDVIATVPGDTYAVIASVGDYMAITGNLVVAGDGEWAPGPVPSPGDTITVVGSVGSIPDYQRGLTLVIDVDGVAHFPNAGHFAAALAANQA